MIYALNNNRGSAFLNDLIAITPHKSIRKSIRNKHLTEKEIPEPFFRLLKSKIMPKICF